MILDMAQVVICSQISSTNKLKLNNNRYDYVCKVHFDLAHKLTLLVYKPVVSCHEAALVSIRI